MAASLIAAAVAFLALPGSVLGHGFERPFPLPVPLWLYLAGAATAVAASFVVAALAIRPAPALARYPFVELPRPPAEAISVLLAVIGLAWWVAIVVNPLVGGHLFLPALFFWVLLWVGVPTVSVVLGNPWPALSPIRTIFAVYETASTVLGARPFRAPYAYPSRLSRWPAVALLLAVLSFEFVLPGSYDAGQIALALVAYSALTLLGMALFGTAWLRNAEVFEVLFGWFGRIGMMARRSTSRELCAGCPEGCLPERCIDCPDCVATRSRGEQAAIARPWFTGLTDVRRADWSDAAFVLLALAGVSYDGLRETVVWGRFVGVLFEPVQRLVGPLNSVMVVNAAGLLALWAIFVTAFWLAAWLTRRLAADPAPLATVAGAYAATLLPIAAGYLVAHYFTLLLQGVLWLPELITNPRSVAPAIDWVQPQVIWYASVGAIVLGHVAGVMLAHRLALLQRAERATVVGLPLVAAMIGYTVFSLWIIAQPLTVEP